jgi:DNA adenine methylase
MCISYIGGKSRVGKFIVPFIPKNIEIYTEPFGGMYWVFFNMNLEEYSNLKKVIYNDFNPLNVNVFNCVRNHQELLNVIKDYPSQKIDLFYSFQKELFGGDLKLDLSKPNYDIASKYVYLLTQVWSGTNCEKGKFIDLKGKYKSKFDTFKNKLSNKKWQSYFDKIDIVENLDFVVVIKKYDSPDSYFYCDPPYYNLGEKYYVNHEFDLSTHERLANVLKSIEGKF